MSHIETFTELAYDAREARINDAGTLEAINGACHENAVHLCNYTLEHTDYQPYLRWGTVNHDNYTYNSLEEAEDDGAVHFWMEVKPDTEWLYVDYFSMHSQADNMPRGSLFAQPVLPDSYQTLPNTRFEFDPLVITPDDILCYMDYELLTMTIEPEDEPAQ